MNCANEVYCLHSKYIVIIYFLVCFRHAVSLPLASAYFTTSEPKAKLLTRYISSLKDGDSIGGELANKKVINIDLLLVQKKVYVFYAFNLDIIIEQLSHELLNLFWLRANFCTCAFM